MTSAVLAVKSFSQSPPVISELRLIDSVSIVKKLGGSSVMGVAPTPLLDSLMVISTLHPAAGQVLADLLSFQNSSGLLIKQQPVIAHRRTSQLKRVGPHEFRGNLMMTFGDTRRAMQGSVVMGIVPIRGDVLLAPPDHFALEPSDMLLVITKSRTIERTAVYSNEAARVPQEGPESPPASSRIDPFDSFDSMEEMRSPVMAVSGGSWRAPVWNKSSKQVVIVLGWRTGIGMEVLLKSFDDRLNEGAELHVVSVSTIFFYSSLFTLRGLVYQINVYFKPIFQYLSGPERVHNMEFTARRIKMIHHVGEITRKSCLAKLPLATASSVLILRDDSAKKRIVDAGVSDARALTAAVVISQMMRDEHNESAPITIQFLDSLAQRILKEQPHLLAKLNSLVPVHRNAIETGIIALAASEPKLVGFFERLLFSEPGSNTPPEFITAFSPFQMLSYGSPRSSPTNKKQLQCEDLSAASFWELDALVRGKGMLLLGWHRANEMHHCLNPPNKHEKFMWGESDLLLVAHDKEHGPALQGSVLKESVMSESIEEEEEGELVNSDSIDIKVIKARPLIRPISKASRKYVSFSEMSDDDDDQDDDNGDQEELEAMLEEMEDLHV